MKNSNDLFENTESQKPKSPKPRVMAHVDDAGIGCFDFKCQKCGWESGWLFSDMSISQAKRGIPCEKCN